MPVKPGKSSKLPPSPPKLIKELSDQTVRAGQPAILSVQIHGNPEPTIDWSVDGDEVFEDQGIEISQDGNIYSMIIKETVEEDEGIYECVAKNNLGEVASAAKLTIEEEYSKPEFLQKLTYQEIEVGGNVEFVVEVVGNPDPEITWFKDQVELEDAEEYSFFDEDFKHSLTVKNCE